jgi:putative DNA methylase
LKTYGDLFTDRQLVALTTFSDLVQEVRARVKEDGILAGLTDDGKGLSEGGLGASAYADAVTVYLGIAIDKATDYNSTICGWINGGETLRNTFGRQAIPMVWDYCEANILGEATGSFLSVLGQTCLALEMLPSNVAGLALQQDAQSVTINQRVVSTDPPYYDNIGYADLSDYFYVWLRYALKPQLPKLFSTLAVPKSEELVATPYRHGGKDAAEKFFLDGMTSAMRCLAQQAHPAFPITIYYAFKQAESEGNVGTASTGWETFLNAVIKAGFAICGTWPVRTERSARSIGIGTNALASSIVLVCRTRMQDAAVVTKKELISALKVELPIALAHLQRGNIAPVDLAQASIGPGMAIFTRYSKVLDAAGKELTVREALTLINEVLDEVMTAQEGDFDADSRWALTWFEQAGFSEGEYGTAETLANARNTSVSGMVQAGILKSSKGKVRLLKPEELPADWDSATDARLTAWEVVHHLIRVLEAGGEGTASELVKKLGGKAEAARELAYRLYTICERKKRAQEALSYNALVQSWPEITRLAHEEEKPVTASQTGLFDA